MGQVTPLKAKGQLFIFKLKGDELATIGAGTTHIGFLFETFPKVHMYRIDGESEERILQQARYHLKNSIHDFLFYAGGDVVSHHVMEVEP